MATVHGRLAMHAHERTIHFHSLYVHKNQFTKQEKSNLEDEKTNVKRNKFLIVRNKATFPVFLDWLLRKSLLAITFVIGLKNNKILDSLTGR
jgi:hypothetical protein